MSSRDEAKLGEGMGVEEVRVWALIGVLSALALVLGYVETFIPLPVPLRASPSISYSNVGSLQLIGNGSNYAVTALAYSGRSEAGVNLSVTTSGISTNHLYFLTKTNQDCYIDLSADL